MPSLLIAAEPLRVGALDFADVRELRDLGEDVFHLALDRCRVDPARRLEDDRRALAGLLREAVFEQVQRFPESEEGSLNSSVNSEPAEPASIPTPIRATIQLRITVLRCPVVQVAKRLIERRTVANRGRRTYAAAHPGPAARFSA